jgi:hypothetical protein
MLPVGFEPAIPASERPQTFALDRAATGTAVIIIIIIIITIIIIIIVMLVTRTSGAIRPECRPQISVQSRPIKHSVSLNMAT